MAIRKFRKKMKLITYIITIAFVVSSLALYIMTQMNYSKSKNYAFKLNGNKVSMENIARNKYMVSRGNGVKVEEKVYEILALNKTIEDELSQQLADDLKIKISKKEINKEYSKIEDSVKDKDQFNRMLRAQGYTKASLKKEIGKSLRAMKLIEYYVENVKISEEEILSVYNENKAIIFQDKGLEEVKDEIEKSLSKEKGNEEYLKAIYDMKQAMKIEDIREQIKDNFEKAQLEKLGIKFSNVEYDKVLLGFINSGEKETQAREKTENYLNAQAKLLNLAKDYKVAIEEELPLDLKVREAYKNIFKKVKNDVSYTDEDLKNFFKENSSDYDTYASVNSYIAELEVKPSLVDKEATQAKAEKILKEVNKDNFAEVARKKSEGPTASRGGDLGTFSKEMMVKEFSEAVFKGKVGEVYPKVVNTIFGSHIIYIAERNDEAGTARASHILIKSKVSETTNAEYLKAAKETVNKISDGEIKFTDLPKDKYVINSLYTGINEAGYIPGLEFNEELVKEIYKVPLNKVSYKKINEKIYIFKKIKETPFKKAKYNDVKSLVKEDYIVKTAMETLKEKLK
ncbi:peptidylprolyl isomerase [Fusobacterium sp. MFO224]|uniref:peptidylprolyl isomerase n=1 Tax=Fusobacterium sp. MFO224 TaxID=3378070 RepID=UPI0038526284